MWQGEYTQKMIYSFQKGNKGTCVCLCVCVCVRVRVCEAQFSSHRSTSSLPLPHHLSVNPSVHKAPDESWTLKPCWGWCDALPNTFFEMQRCSLTHSLTHSLTLSISFFYHHLALAASLSRSPSNLLKKDIFLCFFLQRGTVIYY